jgi:hypothetical protein
MRDVIVDAAYRQFYKVILSGGENIKLIFDIAMVQKRSDEKNGTGRYASRTPPGHENKI